MAENAPPEGGETTPIGELEEPVGELNTVAALLENGNENRNSGKREAAR